MFTNSLSLSVIPDQIGDPGILLFAFVKRKTLDSYLVKWTEAVETELCRIGQDSGYKVYAQDVPINQKDGGEWLYDVTWLKYEKSGRGELIKAPLVAECEWGDIPHIEDDFEKLLLARAGIRVMIVESNDEPDSRIIAERLAGKVKAFKGSRAEGAWLLAVTEKNNDWRFRYFTIESLHSAIEC